MTLTSVIPALAAAAALLAGLVLATCDPTRLRGAWVVPASASLLFAAFSAVAVALEGPVGFWPVHTANLWGNQVWIDLLVDGVRQPRLTLFAGVNPQTGQPFQASAATMPLSLQVALPRAQSLPGAENAKVVAAPAPATTTKETRDPRQVGANFLALPGQDTAQITGAEGLLNFRGRGDQADATR